MQYIVVEVSLHQHSLEHDIYEDDSNGSYEYDSYGSDEFGYNCDLPGVTPGLLVPGAWPPAALQEHAGPQEQTKPQDGVGPPDNIGPPEHTGLREALGYKSALGHETALGCEKNKLGNQKTLGHQTTLSHEKALSHQSTAGHPNTLDHGKALGHQNTLGHENTSSYVMALGCRNHPDNENALCHENALGYETELRHQGAPGHGDMLDRKKALSYQKTMNCSCATGLGLENTLDRERALGERNSLRHQDTPGHDAALSRPQALSHKKTLGHDIALAYEKVLGYQDKRGQEGYKTELRHQSARGHGGMLTREKALGYQNTLRHQGAQGHDSAPGYKTTLGHQNPLGHEEALGRQEKLNHHSAPGYEKVLRHENTLGNEAVRYQNTMRYESALGLEGTLGQRIELGREEALGYQNTLRHQELLKLGIARGVTPTRFREALCEHLSGRLDIEPLTPQIESEACFSSMLASLFLAPDSRQRLTRMTPRYVLQERAARRGLGGYTDATSSAGAAACHDNPLVTILPRWMARFYGVGAVVAQWIVFGAVDCRDESQVVLLKLLHMGALASCVTIAKETRDLLFYLALARPVLGDFPRAALQTVFRLKVYDNYFLFVSVAIGIASSLKAARDASDRAMAAHGASTADLTHDGVGGEVNIDVMGNESGSDGRFQIGSESPSSPGTVDLRSAAAAKVVSAGRAWLLISCHGSRLQRLPSHWNSASAHGKSPGASGAEYGIGEFRTPSLGQLREAARRQIQDPKVVQAAGLRGPLRVEHSFNDAAELHRRPENRLALFQVASQTNCLSLVSPTSTPEMGVTAYIDDRSQGPCCAIACGAGTVFRNYFAQVPGGGAKQVGQSQDRQLNCLEELCEELGSESNGYFEVRGGFTLASDAGLQDLNAKLAGLDEEGLDHLRSRLRVGVHEDVEVTSYHWGCSLLRDPEQLVTQVFTSVCSVAQSGNEPALWQPLARLTLEATYEAALWAAVLSAIRNKGAHGSLRVYLTTVGRCLLGHGAAWIAEAVQRAIQRVCMDNGLGLQVFLVAYKEPALQELADVFEYFNSGMLWHRIPTSCSDGPPSHPGSKNASKESVRNVSKEIFQRWEQKVIKAFCNREDRSTDDDSREALGVLAFEKSLDTVDGMDVPGMVAAGM
ncbi:unnamed protein product, partial [Prorocentrum cordatum]